MRRLLWLLAGLSLLATGIYLAGRAPSAYVLEKECERYHEQRRGQYWLLHRRIAKGDVSAAGQLEGLLRETERIEIRGWEVVLVPAGALAPGQGFTLATRIDPSAPPDPPPLKGPMEAWITPRGLLAKAFARR